MATQSDAEILDVNFLTPDGRVVEQADPLPTHPRAGDLCPVCQDERLDYDGLLNLSCPDADPQWWDVLPDEKLCAPLGQNGVMKK